MPRVLLALVLTGTAALSASELAVMSAGAMEAAIAPLALQFQRASGHTVTVEYGTAPQLAAMLDRGQPADVVIAPAAVMDQAIGGGQAIAATRLAVGRIGVGVFVRTGEPAPDVSSESALRAALLSADHIVYTQGSSGQYIDALFGKLGVVSQLASKLVRVADADTALARDALPPPADGHREARFRLPSQAHIGRDEETSPHGDPRADATRNGALAARERKEPWHPGAAADE